MMLEIADDGRGDVHIVPKPGHWGVRTIQESARLVHGNVEFVAELGKGTCVKFTFPARYDPVENGNDEPYSMVNSAAENKLEHAYPDTSTSCDEHISVNNAVTSNCSMSTTKVTSDA